MKAARTAKCVLAAVFAAGLGPSFANAGAVGGPKGSTTNVEAHSYDSFTVRFRADEPARVTVHGDGDTQLVARVYDEDDNLIVSDTDADGTGMILLRWTPKWTGVFKIRVINRGSVYNHYRIETN